MTRSCPRPSRPDPASRKRRLAAAAVVVGATWPLACLDDARHAMPPPPRPMAEVDALGACLAAASNLHEAAVEQSGRLAVAASCRPRDLACDAERRDEAEADGDPVFARIGATWHARLTLLQGLEHDANCRASNDPQCATYLPKNLDQMRLSLRASAEALRLESEFYRATK